MEQAREALRVLVPTLMLILVSACAKSNGPDRPEAISPTAETARESAPSSAKRNPWLLASEMPAGLSDPTLPEARRIEIAFDFLTSTEVFQSTLIGFAARPSPAACSFRLIADAPDAMALFKRLFDQAALPGKLYALIGLYREDPEYYRSASGQLVDSEEVIPYHSADVISNAKVGVVIANPGGEGYIDIASGFLTDRFYKEARCPSK